MVLTVYEVNVDYFFCDLGQFFVIFHHGIGTPRYATSTSLVARSGSEVVAELKYQSGNQDFTTQLTELISKKPLL